MLDNPEQRGRKPNILGYRPIPELSHELHIWLEIRNFLLNSCPWSQYKLF